MLQRPRLHSCVSVAKEKKHEQQQQGQTIWANAHWQDCDSLFALPGEKKNYFSEGPAVPRQSEGVSSETRTSRCCSVKVDHQGLQQRTEPRENKHADTHFPSTVQSCFRPDCCVECSLSLTHTHVSFVGVQKKIPLKLTISHAAAL